MIAEHTTLATMALAMGTFGLMAGLIEAGMIRDRINSGLDGDLDHGALLTFRVILGAAVAAVLALAYAWFLYLDDRAAWGTVGLHALRLVAMGWASFTIAHRLSLNSARKKQWWYCAPGNAYDRVFLWVMGGDVKAASTAMFAFEGLVAAVTIWSLWW